MDFNAQIASSPGRDANATSANTIDQFNSGLLASDENILPDINPVSTNETIVCEAQDRSAADGDLITIIDPLEGSSTMNISSSNPKFYDKYDFSPFKKYLKIDNKVVIAKRVVTNRSQMPPAVTGTDYFDMMQKKQEVKANEAEKKRQRQAEREKKKQNKDKKKSGKRSQNCGRRGRRVTNKHSSV